MAFKVLFTSAEVAPFKKSGGLGDVAGSLPKALARRGLDVRVVMPLYQGLPWDDLEPLDGVLEVPMYFGRAHAAVRLGHLPGSDVRVYFIDHRHYFDRPNLYGPPGEGYPDNLERFVFLSRATLELACALGFTPDVVHANDWQTALAPLLLGVGAAAKPLANTASVYTIHNLAYQGDWDPGAMFVTGLAAEHYNSHELEHFGRGNLTKGAIRHATLLSTVSPTYAREIQTSDLGCGLDGELAMRGADLRGILNGIDTDAWNPATDVYLPARYDAEHMEGKAKCKAALQRELGLAPRPDVPLFGMVGRLAPQKGVDILAHALERILSWDVQVVLLGSGDPQAEREFAALSAARPDKFRATLGFQDPLAHRIEAGSDFFLMPSRFEPCGLNQMYSMRYGTLPIVRATGGLADTVQNFDERSGQGTGFVFHDLTAGAFADTVGWAAATFAHRKPAFAQLRQQAMAKDFSWARAADAYEHLYLEAYERQRHHPYRG